jgi:hypothetical protein
MRGLVLELNGALRAYFITIQWAATPSPSHKIFSPFLGEDNGLVDYGLCKVLFREIVFIDLALQRRAHSPIWKTSISVTRKNLIAPTAPPP